MRSYSTGLDSFGADLEQALQAVPLARLLMEIEEQPVEIVSVIADRAEMVSDSDVTCLAEWGTDSSLLVYLFPRVDSEDPFPLAFVPRILRIYRDGTVDRSWGSTIPVRQFVLWLTDREVGGVAEPVVHEAVQRSGYLEREAGQKIHVALLSDEIYSPRGGVLRAR